jgi:hypothetical protein
VVVLVTVMVTVTAVACDDAHANSVPTPGPRAATAPRSPSWRGQDCRSAERWRTDTIFSGVVFGHYRFLDLSIKLNDKIHAKTVLRLARGHSARHCSAEQSTVKRNRIPTGRRRQMIEALAPRSLPEKSDAKIATFLSQGVGS